MAIYAIADLHLSDFHDKSMDIFGEHWKNHMEKIETAWLEQITDDDTVLIPGDISWAMKLEEAMPDIQRIGQLPGDKYMIRGNHDFWWNSIGKVRRALPKGLTAIQNDCCLLRDGTTVVCGTRGWALPGSSAFDEEDTKIYHRELGRLKLSLDDAKRKGAERIIVMTHFPPMNDRHEDNGFTEIFAEYGVEYVVYGHLHGVGTRFAFEGERNGTEYRLVSCDHLRFSPVKILD